MLRFIRDALDRLRRDERGNVFVLFGASAIPLLLILGGAVDIARYMRYKTELSNAVDSAALALAREHDDYTEAQATTFVNNFVNSFAIADSQFTVQNLHVTKLTNGFHVTVQGDMKTIFLPLGRFTKDGTGVASMDANIVSEVVNSTNRVEVALVLDNTGSMTTTDVGSNSCDTSKTRMAGVRCAAKTLVDQLMQSNTTSNPTMVKIGIVPFEGSVNIKNEDFSDTWIDKGTYDSTKKLYYATATYNGVNFNAPATGKRLSHYSLWSTLKTRTSLDWAGCVEMRAGTNELSLTPPSSGDTLFVQMFWPDEPDITKYNNVTQQYWNNYLTDVVTSSREARQLDYTKYTNISTSTHWASSATTYPQTTGPNRGCPLAVVPLSTDKSRLETAIATMQPNAATGTYIPAGLYWGWQVVDSAVPFTEGVAPGNQYYDKTVKAVVLLTDGENSATYQSASTNHNQSPYSAFGYLAKGRLSNSSENAANGALDTKTTSLCTSMKTAGVRLYTIIFGSVDSSTQTLMRNCATVSDGASLYYLAPTSAQLQSVFQQIGQDLTDIHLSM